MTGARHGYVVTQRTREIGIRIALGVRSAQLKRVLLGQVLVLVGIGVALGLGGAALLTRGRSGDLRGRYSYPRRHRGFRRLSARAACHARRSGVGTASGIATSFLPRDHCGSLRVTVRAELLPVRFQSDTPRPHAHDRPELDTR